MIVALINWRILPTGLDAFLLKWKTELKLGDAPGLIGEYLSRVEDISFFNRITWEMEPDEKDAKEGWRDESYVSYVNVGLWVDLKSFDGAVGRYMNAGRSLTFPFEAAPRRRAVLNVEHWRRGNSDLPPETSAGVVA